MTQMLLLSCLLLVNMQNASGSAFNTRSSLEFSLRTIVLSAHLAILGLGREQRQYLHRVAAADRGCLMIEVYFKSYHIGCLILIRNIIYILIIK
jgi:hypothetical protein